MPKYGLPPKPPAYSQTKDSKYSLMNLTEKKAKEVPGPSEY